MTPANDRTTLTGYVKGRKPLPEKMVAITVTQSARRAMPSAELAFADLIERQLASLKVWETELTAELASDSILQLLVEHRRWLQALLLEYTSERQHRAETAATAR